MAIFKSFEEATNEGLEWLNDGLCDEFEVYQSPSQA